MAHEEEAFTITQIAHKRIPQKAHKRNTRITPDTRQHLNGFTLIDRRLPQTFTQTPKKENESRLPFVLAGESSLPRPSAWSRRAPTPFAAGEPSPALLAQTRRSSPQPALPRLPSVPPLVRPLAKHSTTLSLLLSTQLLCPSATFTTLNSTLPLCPSTTSLCPSTTRTSGLQPLHSVLQPLEPSSLSFNHSNLLEAAWSAFSNAGLRPLPRLVFSPASLRASPRSFSKGACPLQEASG